MTDYRETAQEITVRIIGGFVGLILFLLMFQILPSLYFQYVDTTQYFQVHEVKLADVKTFYKACEGQRIQINRTSLVNAAIKNTTELVELVKLDSLEVQFESYKQITEGALDIGTKNVMFEVKLPCKLSPGIYFWRFNTSYQVRGIEKNLSWQTPEFTVIPE